MTRHFMTIEDQFARADLESSTNSPFTVRRRDIEGPGGRARVRTSEPSHPGIEFVAVHELGGFVTFFSDEEVGLTVASVLRTSRGPSPRCSPSPVCACAITPSSSGCARRRSTACRRSTS